jgi:hypothetical protein
MTDWAKLAEPFPENEIKQRQGPGGRMLSYVDARAVAQRLDDVLTPEGWDFTWTLEGEAIVHGRLIIGGVIREDAGYPNSDRDEEPIKAAVSDALKRCGVLFGIGRHLYDDNHSAGRASAAPSPRPAPRPHVVDTSVPDEPDDMWDDMPLSKPRVMGTDTVTCPIHDVPWKGEPGDLWHKDPEGRYCRHPENVRKARAR